MTATVMPAPLSEGTNRPPVATINQSNEAIQLNIKKSIDQFNEMIFEVLNDVCKKDSNASFMVNALGYATDTIVTNVENLVSALSAANQRIEEYERHLAAKDEEIQSYKKRSHELQSRLERPQELNMSQYRFHMANSNTISELYKKLHHEQSRSHALERNEMRLKEQVGHLQQAMATSRKALEAQAEAERISRIRMGMELSYTKMKLRQYSRQKDNGGVRSARNKGLSSAMKSLRKSLQVMSLANSENSSTINPPSESTSFSDDDIDEPSSLFSPGDCRDLDILSYLLAPESMEDSMPSLGEQNENLYLSSDLDLIDIRPLQNTNNNLEPNPLSGTDDNIPVIQID